MSATPMVTVLVSRTATGRRTKTERQKTESGVAWKITRASKVRTRTRSHKDTWLAPDLERAWTDSRTENLQVRES